jgi:hypothetical protein
MEGRTDRRTGRASAVLYNIESFPFLATHHDDDNPRYARLDGGENLFVLVGVDDDAYSLDKLVAFPREGGSEERMGGYRVGTFSHHGVA